MFNILPTAKVIMEAGSQLKVSKSQKTDMISQGSNLYNPWFTRQAVYPLNHGSYLVSGDSCTKFVQSIKLFYQILHTVCLRSVKLMT